MDKTTFYDANNNLMCVHATHDAFFNEYRFQIINDTDDLIEDLIIVSYTRPNQVSMVRQNGDVFNAGKMYDFLKKWINDGVKARRQGVLEAESKHLEQDVDLNVLYGIFPNHDGMIGVFEVVREGRKVDVVRVVLYAGDDNFTHYQQVNTYLLYPGLERFFESLMLKAREELIKLNRLIIE